jgi:hypothetical protein
VPIFIVGMHRSGTTLLEQLLGGHSEVKAIGELYDFTSAMRYVTDHHCKGVVDATIVERARRTDLREAVPLLGERELEQTANATSPTTAPTFSISASAHALHAKILHMVRDQ